MSGGAPVEPPRGRIEVRGVPVAPGLAVGTAVFHNEGELDIPVLELSAVEVEPEQQRLSRAVAAAKLELEEMERSIGREVGRRDARIFSVQQLLLDDPVFSKDLTQAISEQRVNAEVAVRDAVEAWSARLAGVPGGDPVADLRDVGRRLQRHLAGAAGLRPLTADPGGKVVLVTRELLPSDTAQIDRARLAAIVTASGGAASHAAILARALGIPAVTDVDTSALPARGGPWIVDGSEGLVILNPGSDEVIEARAASERFLMLRNELLQHTRGLAHTADDVAVELMANVENFAGLPEELIEDLGGIGLYRTEFLFMARSSFPSQEEQFNHYVEALQRMGGREVTFRTIDVGGDKPLPYFRVPAEPNPVLGWRGLRLSLQWPDMFYTQVRALLRASAHGRMRILVPMVTTLEEFRHARRIVQEIMGHLEDEGVPYDANVPVGAMVEVPAMALAARSLAEAADFLSVGTNDLSQYALAVDRNNARVADLYQPLHPGVIQLLISVIRAAGAAGTPVSVCGEMAGEPDAALLLLGLGMRSFSMSPYHLPAVRRLFAAISTGEATDVAAKVRELDTVAEIRALLRRHVLSAAPELLSLLPALPAGV